MARIPRKNINTPFLHIMIQGNNKNFLLKDNNDKEKYLDILSLKREKVRTLILKYTKKKENYE